MIRRSVLFSNDGEKTSDDPKHFKIACNALCYIVKHLYYCCYFLCILTLRSLFFCSTFKAFYYVF